MLTNYIIVGRKIRLQADHKEDREIDVDGVKKETNVLKTIQN